MNNSINHNRTPVVGAIEPIDDDFDLTADYLMGEATPDQVAEFERRFVVDAEFYDKVAPAVKAWTLPVSFREIMERTPNDALAKTVPAIPAIPAIPVRLATDSPAPTASLIPAVIPFAKPRSLRKGRFIRRVMRTATLLQAAAAVVFVALYGLLYWKVLRPDRPNELTQAMNARNAATAPPGGPIAASIQPAPSIPSPRSAGTPGAAIPKTPRARPDTGLAEHGLMRAVLATLGTEARTGDGETKLFELPHGIRILLRPNSSFHFMSMPLMRSSVAISFDGELSVDLPASDDIYLSAMLIAPQGRITVIRGMAYNDAAGKYLPSPTQFAVRCHPGCAAVEVTMATGHARVSSADELAAISLDAGQFGLAYATLPPTVVEPDKATNFPVPDLTMRRQP